MDGLSDLGDDSLSGVLVTEPSLDPLTGEPIMEGADVTFLENMGMFGSEGVPDPKEFFEGVSGAAGVVMDFTNREEKAAKKREKKAAKAAKKTAAAKAAKAPKAAAPKASPKAATAKATVKATGSRKRAAPKAPKEEPARKKAKEEPNTGPVQQVLDLLKKNFVPREEHERALKVLKEEHETVEKELEEHKAIAEKVKSLYG